MARKSKKNLARFVKVNKWLKAVDAEVLSHKIFYLLLLMVLAGAFYARIYRAQDLMAFYYDQGRDALVIWRLWHEGRPFLIGPITGLAGIFLGPLYYYLIAPFYLIGGGDPRIPAVFLATLTVMALPVLYILGWRMQSRATGVIAAAIGGFSYFLVLSGRWLSNPTLMFPASVFLLWVMWKIVSKNQGSDTKTRETNSMWILVSLLVGVSLQ